LVRVAIHSRTVEFTLDLWISFVKVFEVVTTNRTKNISSWCNIMEVSPLSGVVTFHGKKLPLHVRLTRQMGISIIIFESSRFDEKVN
jgi:hypothetical protein